MSTLDQSRTNSGRGHKANGHGSFMFGAQRGGKENAATKAAKAAPKGDQSTPIGAHSPHKKANPARYTPKNGSKTERNSSKSYLSGPGAKSASRVGKTHSRITSAAHALPARHALPAQGERETGVYPGPRSKKCSPRNPSSCKPCHDEDCSHPVPIHE